MTTIRFSESAVSAAADAYYKAMCIERSSLDDWDDIVEAMLDAAIEHDKEQIARDIISERIEQLSDEQLVDIWAASRKVNRSTRSAICNALLNSRRGNV